MRDGRPKTVRPDHERDDFDEPDLPGTHADPRSRPVIAEHEKERVGGLADQPIEQDPE
jgi:hypothetical protein